MVLNVLFSLVPAMMLLTVSFFVLVAVSKIQSKALRNFGKIIAVVLCIFAGLSIIASIYLGITGKFRKGSWKSPFMPHWQYHLKTPEKPAGIKK